MYALSEKARFVGDKIAAVAAVDAATAQQALELIKVEYETLPAVFDPTDAMKPGAQKKSAGKRKRPEKRERGRNATASVWESQWMSAELSLLTSSTETPLSNSMKTARSI